MARKPGPSQLIFTLAASGISSTIYAEDVQIKYATKDFNREEWSNSKLQQAMDAVTFAKPIIQSSAVNSPIQVGIESCGFSNIVPLGPDDANLANILQRQVITEFTITGSPSAPSAVEALRPVALDHKKRLDQFDEYLAELGQNISYQRLLALRGETFSYLTNTGLSVTDALDSSFNLSGTALLTDLSSYVVYYNPTALTAKAVGWTATIQVITFESRVGTY